MLNLAHFQQDMRLPFENEIFQMMSDLAEILHASVCTHLPPSKNCFIHFGQQIAEKKSKCPNGFLSPRPL